MAMHIGTTPDASLLRLVQRVSPVIGAAWRCGTGGRDFASGEGLPADGIAGTRGEDAGGRVPTLAGAT